MFVLYNLTKLKTSILCLDISKFYFQSNIGRLIILLFLWKFPNTYRSIFQHNSIIFISYNLTKLILGVNNDG